MRYLLDTGILLRVVNRQAAMHDQIRQAVRALKSSGHITLSCFQNRSEFWNVCTRPTTARGGFGLTVEEARRRLRVVERITALLPDVPEAYDRWKDLLEAHAVQGVQVHDAKLVALMMCHGVAHLLTLNASDFVRYSSITALTPEDVLGQPSP
jgi:predicted nucleic acid-binding protein